MERKDMAKPYLYRCSCYSMNPNVKSCWKKCKHYNKVFIDSAACEHLVFPNEFSNDVNVALCQRKYKG